MMPSSGMVPASSTPIGLAMGQRTLTASEHRLADQARQLRELGEALLDSDDPEDEVLAMRFESDWVEDLLDFIDLLERLCHLGDSLVEHLAIGQHA